MRFSPLFLLCPLLMSIPSVAFAQSDTLVEGFEDVPALSANGWVFANNSSVPAVTWGQGNVDVFAAQSGFAGDYAGVGSGSTLGDAPGETISNWLLTPTLTLTPDSVLSFWTRTVDVPFAPDRLEVRLSTSGDSANVGVAPTDTGDFVTTLLTINPDLNTTDYPNAWTQYTLPLAGLVSTVTGRIGFRYFVEDGGVFGANSDYIGLDTLQVTAAPTVVPEAGGGVLALLGAGVLALRNGRRGYGVRRSTCPSKKPAVISPSP